MSYRHSLNTIQRLMPILVTGLIITVITLVFSALAGTDRLGLSVKADSVHQTLQQEPIVQSNIALSSDSFLPSTLQRTVFTGSTIPILMYHYIRDYHNPADQMGMNLSVSPTNFVTQLKTIKEAGYTPVTFKDLAYDLPAKPIVLTFDDGYTDAYTTAFPALKAQQMKGVFYLVSGSLNKTNYITDDQAKELHQAGMEIGAHTVSHRDLSHMNATAQKTQLLDSKLYLENLIGDAVTAFCYPGGKYNQTTVALAKEVGFTTATTTKPGVATIKSTQETPYELKRIRVTNGTDLSKYLKEQQ